MKKEERAIKIKLLEEIKAELWKDFEELVAGSKKLEELGVYDLQMNQMLLRELASFHIADLRLNRILYPLYWEIQEEEKDTKRTQKV